VTIEQVKQQLREIMKICVAKEKEKLRLGNKLNYGCFSNSKWRQV